MSIVVNKTRLPVTEWQTESGSVVSISDARMRNAKSLAVSLEPIQNLHGYDAPWVGGAGKNLFDIEKATIGSGAYGLSISRSGDTIRIYGTCSASGTATKFFAILSYADYSLSGKSYVIQAFDVVGGTFTSVYGFRTATEKSVAVGMVLTENQQYDVTFKISVSATSQTEWTPYENLCPISGRSSVSMYDDPKYGGKIWWNQIITVSDFINGTHNGITYTKHDDGTITISGTLQSGATNTYRIIIASSKYVAGHKYFGSVGNKNSSFLFWHNASEPLEKNEGIFTVNNLGNGFYVYRKGISGGYEINETLRPWCCDLTAMFGAGNEPTLEQFRALFPKDYYDYNAGTETLVSAVNGDPCWDVLLNLGQTVYGCTVDLVSGVMTVDRAKLTLDNTIPSGTAGIRNITEVGSSVRFEYYPYRSIGAGQSAPLLSDKFVNADTSAGNPWCAATGPSSPRMYVTMGSQYNTDALIRGWFSDNPTDFVYQLATPQTIQLSPNQIEMLMRNNTVWSDAGQITLNYARIHS